MKQFELKERFNNLAHNALPLASRFPACENNEAWKLLKIISGSTSYKHYKSVKFIPQNKNYLRPDFHKFPGKWHSGLTNYLSEDMTFSEIFDEYQKTINLQRQFYKSMNLELLNFLRFQKSGNHTTAFIYLYRMLEFSAYAAPMLFILSEKSFTKSYNEISSWFSSDKKKSELAFFKKFTESVFDNDFMQTELDFKLTAPTEEIRKQHYKLIKRLAAGNSYKFTEVAENENFSIPYKDISSLIITIRNRFFHYTISRSNNIKSKELMDSDDFFASINDTAMHWLATLFANVAQKSILSN